MTERKVVRTDQKLAALVRATKNISKNARMYEISAHVQDPEVVKIDP